MSDTTELPSYTSPWDQEMYRYLTSHARIEGELLEAYLDAAKETESKAFAYVVDLLAEDERRHHRFFHEIAQSLRADVEMRGEQPEVPHLDLRRADRERVRSLTKELLENEEHDAVELKRLRKAMRDFEDTTLWGLLVDVMQHDTAKHVAILKFVQKHT
jgi:rubrerythrin